MPGTVFVDDTKTDASKSRLLPFEFSNNQAYVIELGNLYARFFTMGGRIENPPGTPVEIVTPYLAADLFAIQFCQSADFLYLVHPKYAPMAITRTSNIAWSIITLNFKDGPYQDENLDNTYTLTASATTGTGITVSSNTAGTFNANSVGTIIRLEEATTSKFNTWATLVAYQANEQVTYAGNVYKVTNGGGSIPAYINAHGYSNNDSLTNAGNIYGVTSGGTSSAAPTFTSGTATVGGVGYVYLGAVADISSRALGAFQSGVGYAYGYYIYYGNNVYVSVNSGTSGQDPPTHTNGAVSDGGIFWLFVGKHSGTRPPIHTSGTESDGILSWLFLNSGFGVVKVTGYTDSQHVTADVIVTFPTSVTGGTLNWRLGAFGVGYGYPAAITFYDQRLCFAATTNQPQTIWMSNTGDYYNFAPTTTQTNVLDTNAITITLSSGEVDNIVWMSQQDDLLVGTTGGEWAVGPATITKGLAPSNVKANLQGAKGSKLIPVRLINQATLFIHRSGNRLYELTYNYSKGQSGSYVPKDLTLLSDHILRDGGGAIDSAYQQEPFSVVWVLRSDGVLAGCTYLPDQDVVGWTRIVLAGTIESIACIPGGPNGENQLWMIVNRTINGGTVRYVEYMAAQFYPANPQDKDSMWFVEAGLSIVSGSPISTASGLGHLEGQTVVAIVDGAVQPSQVVTGGSIPLTIAGLNVVVGLPYTSSLTTLPIDADGAGNTAQGKLKKIWSISFRLLNSLGFAFGVGAVSDQNFRTLSMTMGQSPDLFTGDYEENVDSSSDKYAQITISQMQPYPLNVLALMPRVQIFDS